MKRSLPLVVLFVVACKQPAPVQQTAAQADTKPAAPTSEEAARFIDDAERRWHELYAEADHADWVAQNFITDDTELLSAKASERKMTLIADLVHEAAKYKDVEVGEPHARKLHLLTNKIELPAPAEAAERTELAEIASAMTAAYGKAKVCKQTPKGEVCRNLQDLVKVMATSRNYDELLEAWDGWHTTGRAIKEQYERFVILSKHGANNIGFDDMGELWRSRFDMPPADLEKETARLWKQLEPFYVKLHCYVRKKLSARYGEQKVPKNGPIPAHLLGNMWAQDWSNIYDIVAPYPGKPSANADKKLKTWDAPKIAHAGESFYTGLGFPKLPDTFWERSLLVRPRDREVECHASAWDVGLSGDVRIKMCIEPTEEDLVTIHHELGHIYYYVKYGKQPAFFQEGANDGFHEAIGDTLVLSMTPAYLEKLGLLDNVQDDPKSELNALMKRALERVAFIPFGAVVDEWRWRVFDGTVLPADYNKAWWEMRRKYQGIAPVLDRSADFDAGAKFHVPGNTAYIRYFLAYVLEFQFHRALCKVAGHTGPLNTCSIAGNTAAGRKLGAMLELGASKPWPDALEALSGERAMDATAVLEYFEPLEAFLDEQTAGEQCGW